MHGHQQSGQLDDAIDSREEQARQYVQGLRAFYVHASMFVLGMFAIVAVNLLTLSPGTAREMGAWWSAWALLGWGIGIVVHGIVVRLNRPTSSSTSTWEQRQVDKLLER